ncbi:MDP1 (predicted) [Pycnogonum litorale]
MKRPKLIVFDLDYTLWPFWVDTHVSPPIKRKNDHVLDGSGRQLRCYKDVPEILNKLREQEYTMAVASRTEWPEGGKKLVDLFGWDAYFKYKEIYPGSKVTHFKRFHEKSGVAYDDMLFFDDEMRNVREIGKLGVTAVLVDSSEGLTFKVLEDGLKKFAEAS